MIPIREQMVREALAVAELRAGVPETRDAFRSLLGPPPRGAQWDLARPFSAKRRADGSYQTAGVSTCGLVAAGLLSCVLRLPWDGAHYLEYPHPYTKLDIVSSLDQMGITHGARRKPNEPPQPGDIRCIGSGLSTHVYTIVAIDGSTITSVDGGAVDDAAHGYLQRVRVCRRPTVGQRVVWTIDLDTLASRCAIREWIPAAWARTVAGVQWGLMQIGIDPGPIDGIVGPRTRAAVRELQRQIGVSQTGVPADVAIELEVRLG